MLVPVETRIIADAVGVLHAECGSQIAAQLVAEAIDRVRLVPERSEVLSPCCPDGDADHLLWHELLRGLAVERPDLFGPRLAELGSEPRGDALAFEYLLARRPEHLSRYRGGRGERELVRHARESLAAAVTEGWDGDDGPPPDFTREPEVWVVSGECPLLGPYFEYQRFWGLSLCPHRALRSVVLLPATTTRRNRAGGRDRVTTLLHEGLHGVLAEAADAIPAAYRPKLERLTRRWSTHSRSQHDTCSRKRPHIGNASAQPPYTAGKCSGC